MYTKKCFIKALLTLSEHKFIIMLANKGIMHIFVIHKKKSFQE